MVAFAALRLGMWTRPKKLSMNFRRDCWPKVSGFAAVRKPVGTAPTIEHWPVIHHMAPLNLHKAGNTLVPAYLVLRAKGYDITNQRPTDGDELWIASGPLGRFTAEDTESLLGLVTLAEARGEQWQASDEEIENFLATFYSTGGG